MRLRELAIFALFLLPGCLQEAVDPTSSDVATETIRPVVIAIIDSGVNPYLPAFASATPPVALPPAVELALSSTGTYESRVAADSGAWDSVAPKTLYHFKGTRLLGITFDPTKTSDGIRDIDGHGTAVSEVAAHDAPDAVIVMVQVRMRQDPVSCVGFTQCLLDPSIAEGMEWAASQPWIDVISASLSALEGSPDRSEVHPEMERWLRASESAARSGKLVINSAGNAALPTIQRYTAGPPWVISVGSAWPETMGEDRESAKGGVDVMGNASFEATFPESMDRKYWTVGTSYAAPSVAGTLAQALRLAREEALSDAPPSAARAALNASGIYFDSASWRPTGPQREGIVTDIITGTTIPVLLQPQMGWGYVNGSLAPEIARRILENDLSIPPEKDQSILYQAQWQSAREEYWARWRAT